MPKQCQNVSTHFAIIVEIGVKTHTVSTGCLQVHQRRWIGIILGEIHIKFEATIGIWGVCWASDENLQIKSTVEKKN